MDRVYSAVESNTSPSLPLQELVFGSSTSTVSFIAKRSTVREFVRKGLVEIISSLGVGELGCYKYIVKVNTKDVDVVLDPKLLCTPLSLSSSKPMTMMEANHLVPIVKAIVSKHFSLHISHLDVDIQRYADDVTLYLPRYKREHIYVSEDERSMVRVNLDDFQGYSFIGNGSLLPAALEEQPIPGSQVIHGITVYPSVVDDVVSQSNMIETLLEVNGVESTLSSYGDKLVPVSYNNKNLLFELCDVWGSKYDTLENGDIYIYNAENIPIDLCDGVREILLNHPPLLLTNNLSLETHSSRGEFKDDVKVFGGVKSLPCWSPYDLSTDMQARDTFSLPAASIVVDESGCWINISLSSDDDISRCMIELRSTDNYSETTAKRLQELCSQVWESGLFLTQWAKHLLTYYNRVSTFLLRRPKTYDNIDQAIQSLTQIISQE